MKASRRDEWENAKRGWIKLLWILLFAAALLLCKMYLIDFADVSGVSMYPTFTGADSCLQLKSFYTIERYDIVVAKAEENHLIKRVIGMPNETVQIIDGAVYINAVKLTDDLDIVIEDAGCATNPITLGSDEFFLIGDNRNNSKDSRDFGAFSETEITGEIFVRIFPIHKITTDFSIQKKG